MQTPLGVFYTDLFTSTVIWQSTSGTLSMHFTETRATFYIDGRALYVWVEGAWYYLAPDGKPDTLVPPTSSILSVLHAILVEYTKQFAQHANQEGIAL